MLPAIELAKVLEALAATLATDAVPVAAEGVAEPDGQAGVVLMLVFCNLHIWFASSVVTVPVR